MIYEIEDLLEKWVDYELIIKVMKLAKVRNVLDKSIHNSLIWKKSKWFNYK